MSTIRTAIRRLAAIPSPRVRQSSADHFQGTVPPGNNRPPCCTRSLSGCIYSSAPSVWLPAHGSAVQRSKVGIFSDWAKMRRIKTFPDAPSLAASAFPPRTYFFIHLFSLVRTIFPSMYYLQIKVKNTYSRLSCSQASPKPRPDRKHLRRRISVPSVLTISTLCRSIPTKGKKNFSIL